MPPVAGAAHGRRCRICTLQGSDGNERDFGDGVATAGCRTDAVREVVPDGIMTGDFLPPDEFDVRAALL